MRVLAIDYGDARTGIAISDASGSIVGRTTVIHSRRPQQTAEAIAALVQESGAERLVMGFPRNMDGTEGPRAALYREMAATIQAACGMEVVLWDERRTTVEAHQILSDCNYHGKKRKNTVDAVARLADPRGLSGVLVALLTEKQLAQAGEQQEAAEQAAQQRDVQPPVAIHAAIAAVTQPPNAAGSTISQRISLLRI